ncbi:hypothetical protein KO507_18425 [Gilvimarinus agarilyticus]|uniref:hypothetical protein n=1 Tax=Gilvimarinus sp. 2_MG-2023 TaxID=3062666 RepID=UPI001C0A2F52|nr:hypothetical protein [Gilvimarinus sp. 2_MG-2023]MBU2887746.1 hypothetical protein [Gilvimarinus agarilyticus]MDO6572394.1 hypothetical protein [Gilvimarinus sp. 2_MG-2023]
MKNITTKKLLLSSAIALALVGCGGDNDNDDNSNSGPNSAPTHSGDISLTLSEKDAFRMVNLLQDAVDTDGDILRVRDLKASLDDTTGFDSSQVVRVGVSPDEIAPHIDTGETREIVYTYNISDGKDSVARTATITVTGEDAAPEFDDLFILVDDPTNTELDLLTGVVDQDEEPLSIANFTAADNLQSGLYTIDAETGILTIDTTTVLNGLQPGEAEIFRDNTYHVEDHNHSLERTATFVIVKATDEPAAPIVLNPVEVTVDTDSALKRVSLASPAYVLEPNGDALTIDWDSFTPTNGAPALKFSRSEGVNLGVDGIDFAAYVAEGETKTFSYSYEFNDGNDEHTVSNTLNVTVTGAATANLLNNGGFESDFDSWSSEGTPTITTTSAFGLDFSGAQFASMITGDKLSPNLTGNALENGAGYILEARAALGDAWGGYPMSISGDTSDEVGAVLAYNSWFAHGYNPRTHAIRFTGAQNVKINIEASINAIEMDELTLYKYSIDPGNNLISEENATFSNGAGDWTLVDGAMVANGELVTGPSGDKRQILPLPAGTIKNGHRYVLSMDVAIDDFTGPVNFRASILDPSDASNETTTAGGAFSGIFQNNSANNNLVTVIDPDRNTSITDWETRALELHVGVNVWGEGKNHRIDNVRLIELP